MEKEKQKEKLTNELFRQKFQSQFELVRYAIRLAENMIKSGRDARVKIDIENPAMEILAEIAAGKDQFDDIVEVIPEPKAEYHKPERERYNAKESGDFPKHSERKKSRIIH
jgi:DNA-directed RNA polymerase subunit omega